MTVVPELLVREPNQMLAQSHDQLNKSYAIHCHNLLNQCLHNERLSSDWKLIIESISRNIGSSVVLPFKIHPTNPSDHISYCVQIKTIPGGEKTDSTAFNGVVINKNVSHRKTRQDIQNPRVLLFSTSIVYDGDENKLTSLETVTARENEYLENILAKIVSAKPDIVIVEHAVARIAQEILLDKNITLISNLKHSLLIRIARFTHAKIINSLDSIYSQSNANVRHGQITTNTIKSMFDDQNRSLEASIGTCKRFYCKVFGSKTYAILDGCDEKLGATVILRGGCLPELKRVKKLCAFMIFCDYNWRLERSMLIDQYATLSEEQERRLNELIEKEDLKQNKGVDSDRRLSLIDKNDLLVGDQANKHKPIVIEDNSDPLRSMDAEMSSSFNLSSNFMTITNDISELNNKATEFKKYFHHDSSNNQHQCTFETKKHEKLRLFEKALTTTILSCSPNIIYPLSPIMKADNHIEKLTEYFRGHLLWSKRLPELRGDLIVSKEVYHQQSYDNEDSCDSLLKSNRNFYCKNDKSDPSKHPLLEYDLKQPIKDSPQALAMITDFRAVGPYPFDNCGKQVASTFKELRSHLADIQRAANSQSINSGQLGNSNQEAASVAHRNQILQVKSSLTLPIVTGVLSSNNMSPDTNSINAQSFSNNFGPQISSEPIGQPKDCLDPCNNQFLAVLFSSYSSSSATAPDYCVKPSTIKMNYYGQNDLSLGDFLNRYCFDINYQCPSNGCTTSVMRHTRRFVHGDGCIMIALRSSPYLRPGMTDDNSIVTWSWCRDCTSATPYVKLSEDSKNLSFAKYLEMRFYAHSYCRQSTFDLDNKTTDTAPSNDEINNKDSNQKENEIQSCDQNNQQQDHHQPCRHSIHRDHCQFFASNKIVASFIYLQASLYEIVLPSLSPLAPDSVDLEPIPDDKLPFIREDDFGSLVSFSLNSHEYRKQLNDLSQANVDSNGTNGVVDQKLPLSPSARRKLQSSIQSTITDSYGGLSTPGSSSIEQLDKFAASDKENSGSELNLTLERDPSGSNITKQDFSIGSSSYAATSTTASSTNIVQSGSAQETKRSHSNSKPDVVSSSSKLLDNNNIELQLNDGNVSLYCVVYCALEFQNIRSLLLKHPNGEELYKQSLWNCIPWSAPGGKSGSTFCKTSNDRFIMKEMSKLELQSFLAIANNYFDYIQKSYSEKQPCLLSSILGIYRIVYKNSTTNVSSKLYFLVMQNLFYQRQITQRFDLKGSMRNRLVNTADQSKGSSDLVLMDENLLRITCDHPLFIRAHSKIILNQAIHNDASFLTSLSVMDYSLLVGIDNEKSELVLGIIDYVRPFTWDKKIERVVKSVGSAKMPTIIEPDLYRIRFCEAMDKYFECVPDHWHDLINYCDLDDATNVTRTGHDVVDNTRDNGNKMVGSIVTNGNTPMATTVATQGRAESMCSVVCHYSSQTTPLSCGQNTNNAPAALTSEH